LIATGAVSGGLCVTLCLLLIKTSWTGKPLEQGVTMTELGKSLLTDYLVPFEVASVLLLVVMIGAAYLAKQERR
jgi:NADH:ubiquinone oxidoreductase subunit 6 (subunit J)